MKKNVMVFLGLIFLMSGCAGSSALQPSAFLKQKELLHAGRNFSSEYRSSADLSSYQKVKVLPVSLDYYSSADVPNKEPLLPLAEVIKKDFESALVLAGYDLLFDHEKPDRRTLIIEPALISMSARYNVVYVSSASVGGPLSVGSSTIEIKVRNNRDELLAMAIEKRNSRGGGAANGTYKTKFHHTEAASRKWSEALVKLLQ